MLFYRKLLEVVPEVDPELWNTVYPRVYQDCGGYGSPKLPAVTMASAIALTREMPLAQVPKPNQSVFFTSARLIEAHVPTYFVPRPLLAATLQTQPPRDLRWMDIKWPRTAMLFLLPTGTLIHPVDGDCPYVAVALHQKGRTMRVPVAGCPSYELTNDAVSVFTSAPNTKNLSIYESTLDASVAPSLGSIQSTMPGQSVELDQAGLPQFGPLLPTDAEFASQLLTIGIGLVLCMTCRPELREEGMYTGKKTKSGRELWSPNFLGRTYRVQQQAQGTHASPRLHWRRGHFRNQPFGPEHAQIRLIWIDPMLVVGALTEL